VFFHEDGRRIGDVKRSFGKACERAGIRDFRAYDPRHTCAAWLVSAGADLCEVRDLLGHTTVKMTERRTTWHWLVEPRGIEPLTFALRTRRSPS
jgi:integrase